MTIGKRIRIVRAELRKTQWEFAKLLNTSTSTVCNWENDKMTPKISSLKRIADLAGISVVELIGKEEKKERQEKTEEFEYPFEDKEEYFCLNINGEIIRNLWSGGPFDEGVYKQGHVFKNREEARKERDKRDLQMRFNQFRDKCNGDWKPDWSTHLDNKYHIYKAHGHEQLLISEDLYCTSFVTFGYFHKYEDAERAIELFGDQIKRLFVEE